MKKLFLLPVMMFALVGCNKPAAPAKTYTLVKESITMVDSTQSSTYAKYNGEHEFEDIKFTTADVMQGTYCDTGVIQFKANVGKSTFTTGSFKKATLKIYSTYDYDEVFVVGGQKGDSAAINAARVDSGKKYVDSKGAEFTCYEYTLAVTFDSAKSGLVIEKNPDTSKKGAGYVTSIVLEA